MFAEDTSLVSESTRRLVAALATNPIVLGSDYAACSDLLAGLLDTLRVRWKLTPHEVDVMLKRLRKTIAAKDPLTVQWLAANEEPRREFLFYEFLPPALSIMDAFREFERIKRQCGGRSEWIEDE